MEQDSQRSCSLGMLKISCMWLTFRGQPTTQCNCLFGKADVGWLWHRRLVPCQHENFAKSPQGKPHCWTKRKCFFFQRSCFAGLVLKERCMILPIQARPLFHQRGSWSSFMWISLVLFMKIALVGRNIVW